MRRRVLLLGVLFVAGFVVHGELRSARAQGQHSGPNTWSARSSSGLVLAGTWTATAGPTNRSVTGTWIVIDARGQTLRRGGWSASRSAAGWTGAWRASESSSGREYAGTWQARTSLKTDATLTDLFEEAAHAVVSGTWTAGRQSGAWSIRAF